MAKTKIEIDDNSEKVIELSRKNLKNLLKEKLSNDFLEEIIELIAPIESLDFLTIEYGKKVLRQNPTDDDILFIFENIPSLKDEILEKFGEDFQKILNRKNIDNDFNF